MTPRSLPTNVSVSLARHSYISINESSIRYNTVQATAVFLSRGLNENRLDVNVLYAQASSALHVEPTEQEIAKTRY
eukprot:scaffold105158_cov31-Prasinocladus_malaysianus.AAC.1